MSPDPGAAPVFRALAMQVACRAVNDCPTPGEARARIRATIERLASQVPASAAFLGPDTRLVVFPEYFLTGFPMREGAAEWIAKACLAPGGAEYEALGRIAQGGRLFLAGNAYETDPLFPGLYFQCSFVIGPSGDVVLRYRRLVSLFAPTPYDVWERYLDAYGLEGVFPVARTEIGNLAAIASEEILYPEVARCHAMRGAELFVHSTSDVAGGPRAPKQVAKLARAVENMAYVVSANSAGIEGTPIPAASTDGFSVIVDDRGLVLAEAGAGESVVANAEVDLGALRRRRRRPGMANLLSRQRFELFAASYASARFSLPGGLAGEFTGKEQLLAAQRETIERLARLGVI